MFKIRCLSEAKSQFFKRIKLIYRVTLSSGFVVFFVFLYVHLNFQHISKMQIKLNVIK